MTVAALPNQKSKRAVSNLTRLLQSPSTSYYLDFAHWPEAELELTTENAPAQHSMAKYFEMRRLRWEAKQFWQKDMGSATCGTYYEHFGFCRTRRSLRLLKRHVPRTLRPLRVPCCPRFRSAILALIAATSYHY